MTGIVGLPIGSCFYFENSSYSLKKDSKDSSININKGEKTIFHDRIFLGAILGVQ